MPTHPLSTMVKLKRLHPDAQLPERKSEHAAGMDLYAYLPDGPVGIPPGERKLVPCGFAMELSPGYEAQVRPRSGLSIKQGITVVNTPGTIDADYRGEVMVALHNVSNRTFILENGERIAQMVVSVLPRITVLEVEELSETERGEGGFGSTGQN